MSRLAKILGAGVALAAVLAVHAAAAQVWPSEGPPPPLAARRVKFPSYKIKTLANGLQVLFVPYHEQPSLSYRLLVRAGAVQEPGDKPGVASFVAAMLNQGTTSRSAKEIANTIDSAGGFLGVGSGNELTFVNGAVIKDQTDAALALVADVAQRPAFAEDEIALQRRQALSALQVGYDDPEYLAGAVFDRIIFGLHPYGRPNEGTPDSIARLTRGDLTAFHQRWFAPNNALLALVGDLTEDEAFVAAEKAFGSWARRDVPDFKLGDLPPAAKRVVIVDRPGSAQTEIRVGHLAIPRTHPDYIPFDMAVRILGGEGANRLFGVLRTDRGLTYGASADLHTFKVSGEVVAETDTRSAATGETLRLMVDEFARLQKEPVHPAELRGAQDFIAGNFPLSIESSSAIAEQVLSRLFYGQSLDEIETYLDRVGRVTTEDIQRVSRQLLKPDQLSIVLVGDAAAFVDQLRRLGFTDYDRIPIAQLDLDSPTLRSTAGGRVPPA
ncbi:MAG: pitrilysin family protein [Acidobacteriota bacterium]